MQVTATVDSEDRVSITALRIHACRFIGELPDDVLPFVVAALAELTGNRMPETSAPQAADLPKTATAMFRLVTPATETG